MMRLMAGLIVLLTSIGLSGCDSVAFRGTAGTATLSADDWPFVPVAMRVHPFTALAYEPNAEADADDADEARMLVLEARLELMDQLGHATKGVGEWRFELYVEPRAASRQARQRLEVWQAEMMTVEANSRHYDPITRTYAFKLRVIDPPPTNASLTLVAQLADPRGERLLAEGPVEYRAAD